MSSGIIPLILILLALGVLLSIIVRKFPQLAILDVDNIPEVKEKKKKNEFFKKRAEQHAVLSLTELSKRLRPFLQMLKEIQLRFRKYVGKVELEVLKIAREKRTKKAAEVPVAERKQELDVLLREARQAFEENNLEKGEELFISAIRVDPKHADAYRGLVDVYLEQTQYDEAEESYQFALKLNPDDDGVYVKLGELAEQRGDTAKAIEYIQQAALLNDQLASRFTKLSDLLFSLEQYGAAFEAAKQALLIEPENPKYLDSVAELAILSGDKKTAEEAYQRLRMVNPENQKLDALKDKINKMA